MTQKKLFGTAMLAWFFFQLLGMPAMANDLHSEKAVRESYLQQGAMAQLHRWYQYYENAAVGMDNQLDILAKDVTIVSANGTAQGHEAYAAAVSQLPSNWQNSHDLQSSEIKVREDGTLGLNANITYKNVGMLEGNAIRALDISYDADLVQTDTPLPLFKSITIKTGASVEAGAFEDLYAQNRLLSLVHYWMAMVEHPDRNPEPFREVLAQEVDINFGSGPITGFDELKAWIAGPASSVSASRHDVHNFSYRTLDDGQYELTVDLDWTGIRPDDVWMTAKTRHVWTVKDNPSERFARIKKIRVEVLEPFSVVK